MEMFLFTVFAAAACGGAIAVVLSQNVVRMAFYLVISLGSTAGLFFMLSADFVGATQLLIYVGGTVVLLIFGVMLTASGPFLTIKSSPGSMVLAIAVGACFLMMVVGTVLQVDWDGNAARLEGQYGASSLDRPGYNQHGEGHTTRSIGTALLGARFDKDLGKNREQPSTGYLLPFEIVSVHLLVVLIGAAYLARAKRRVHVPSEF
ncbi:MAG: NADH-quinone oxidoreductase subunit J [Planctomycetaceae bacterium]|nr:NADH-quinone oxidoreductase subunit J [Planctomycetaceae bacterium]